MATTVADLTPTGRAALLGILNVTPDSFSDGGRWLSVDDAVRHGLDLTRPAGDGPAAFGAAGRREVGDGGGHVTPPARRRSAR
ncbi:dihydropteroate synthase [Rathayibacter sp. AY1D7]|uniref:dihydropteroate synthase n=1 Tax=Rathayibacter sp. AY1D7 TaxID=2080547 RepID=UPI001CA57EFA|nr:dihydropteroate synthase [Rathayibacter sp. AY1D7]